MNFLVKYWMLLKGIGLLHLDCLRRVHPDCVRVFRCPFQNPGKLFFCIVYFESNLQSNSIDSEPVHVNKPALSCTECTYEIDWKSNCESDVSASETSKHLDNCCESPP